MELSVVNHHHLPVSRAFYARIRDDWLNTDVRARYYAACIAATHPCPSSDADLAALDTALNVELGRAARTLAAAYPRYAHDAIGVVYALEVVLDDGRKVFKIGHTMHPSTRLRVLSLCRNRLWGAMWRVPWRIHLGAPDRPRTRSGLIHSRNRPARLVRSCLDRQDSLLKLQKKAPRVLRCGGLRWAGRCR